MWEYKRLTFCCRTPDEIIQILNELGKEGWEVIQYVEEGTAFACKKKDTSYFMFLKRMKPLKSEKQFL